MIELSERQSKTAWSSILFTLFWIMMLFRDLHLLKASNFILFTLLGIMIELSERHSENAKSSIILTLFGIVNEHCEEQP